MDREIRVSMFFALPVLLCNSFEGATADSEMDVAVLSAMKESLLDPNDVLRSWESSLIGPCTLTFVECHPDQENHLQRLELGGHSLAGKLTKDVGMLTRPQYLAFYSNELSGAIPKELGNLTTLVSLDLRGNKFSGPIPTQVGQLRNLKFLWLHKNLLTGPIPKSFGQLTELKVLHLEQNALNGTIPESLANLRNLKVLNLSYNNLMGKIPSSLAKFPIESFIGNVNLCGEPLKACK